jgi:ribosomal protein S10
MTPFRTSSYHQRLIHGFRPRRLSYSSDTGHFPRNVQALYLRPLRRSPKFGLPTCDLQLRSYSVRNVEFFSDFALRAAYYLKLPASGPVPLPRIVERWTVPRSNFVHKKSQENFERITLRRLVQIRDGHPEVVQLWLAFLRRHAFYGVGMKANVWENESPGERIQIKYLKSWARANLVILEFGDYLDSQGEDAKVSLESEFPFFGTRESSTREKTISNLIEDKFNSRLKGPMSETRSQ